MVPVTRQILCVDDHEDTCLLITTLLQQANYQVISAHTMADAEQLAKSRQFDLYLLDNHYPDGTGLELCQRLRAFDSVTPIIFYSGDATESFRQQVLASGAQVLLVKPQGFEDLEPTIERLVQSTHPEPMQSE